MYVFIAFSGPKSRIILGVSTVSDCQSDGSALSAALEWSQSIGNATIIEIWDLKENCYVCRLDLDL